jgi:hypothetical protein
MKVLDVKLDTAFNALWKEMEKEIEPVAPYSPHDDDKLWFSSFDVKYTVLLISDPDRFLRVISRKVGKEIKLGKPFVLSIKRDQTEGKSVVQGIGDTGLINVHLGSSLLMGLTIGLLPFLDDLTKHIDPKFEVPNYLQSTLDPLQQPAHPEITIAAEYGRVFTHVKLAEGRVHSTAIAVGYFFGHALDSASSVATWLGASEPSSLKFIRPKDQPTAVSPAHVTFQASREIAEILYIGTSDTATTCYNACLCSTSLWNQANGNQILLDILCAKPYASC